MPKSTDLVSTSDLDEFLSELATGNAETLEDPIEVQKAIIARILSATSADDVLSGGALIHAREVLDVPFYIRSYRIMRSDFDQGLGAYMAIDATDANTGEMFTFSCGGANVMAQVYQMLKLELTDEPVKVIEAPKQTAAGYRPLWLAKA